MKRAGSGLGVETPTGQALDWTDSGGVGGGTRAKSLFSIARDAVVAHTGAWHKVTANEH